MSSHASLNRSPRKWRAWQLASGFAVWTTAFCLVTLAASSLPASASAHGTNPAPKPVKLSVLSPGTGDNAGNEGAGFVVDLTLTARNKAANKSLSAEAGYKPFFNNPSAPTFHPGPNQGAPGLVVMLSTTPNTPGTPFQGPRTNLAGLFQINGVTANNGLIQVRNTWQIAKAGFGSGPSTLTVFVVDGTAPALVPDTGLQAISNRMTVPFTITAPAATAPSPASANANATLKVANDSKLGNILVDTNGRTVYQFDKDQGMTSACTGSCAMAWPALKASGAPTTGTGLDASKVGTANGQVTYAGHLLYLYAGDAKPGDTIGASIPSFAAVSPTGDPIHTN